MSEAPETVDAGPLSIDQAIAALTPPDEQPEAAPVEAAPEEIEASPEAETTDDAAETPSDDVEAEEEAAPAVDAPHFWAAEDKEAFAKLPPELQAVVLKHEEGRVAASNKAIQEAREAEKRATEAAKSAAEVSAKLNDVVAVAEQRFAAKWPEKIDWAATAEQYGVEEAQKLRWQYDADQEAIAAAKAAKQEAERAARQQFAQAEYERLKTVEPELVDPKHGPERFQRLTKFLAERGIGTEMLADAGATELSLAYDAMRWREAQSKAKAQLTPKPVPAAKPVAPAAAKPQQTPQKRAAEQAFNRFAQTKSVNDAVAAILAKG